MELLGRSALCGNVRVDGLCEADKRCVEHLSPFVDQAFDCVKFFSARKVLAAVEVEKVNAVACFPVVGLRVKRCRFKGNIFSALDFSGEHSDFGVVIEPVGTREFYDEVAVKFQDVSQDSACLDRGELVRITQNEQLEVSAGRKRLQERRK